MPVTKECYDTVYHHENFFVEEGGARGNITLVYADKYPQSMVLHRIDFSVSRHHDRAPMSAEYYTDGRLNIAGRLYGVATYQGQLPVSMETKPDFLIGLHQLIDTIGADYHRRKTALFLRRTVDQMRTLPLLEAGRGK